MLIAIPVLAQTDLSGTWSGPVSLTDNQSGCAPLSLSGTGMLTVSQNGSNISGNFTADHSVNPFAPGCPTDSGPITVPYQGTISGNTVTVSALGISGTLSINGSNSLTGTLTSGNIVITIALTKQGSITTGACNLGMTLSCNGANCSATTVNNGSNTCTGSFIAGFVIEDQQNRGTVTNFSTTLPFSSP